MQRYFAKDKINDTFVLYDTDIYHIKKVMRCNVNDKIEVVYQEKVYICNIDSIEPFLLSILNILEEDKSSNVNLIVAVALVQEQKFDLILQKLTELGVDKIIPVKTERSIVKIDKQKEAKKKVRWEMICKEASEQSKRVTIPEIDDIISVRELVNYDCKLKLICSLNKCSNDLGYYLKDDVKNILFFVGPEGGFSNNEEEFMLLNGFDAVSLGKRVLRVETAAMYVASIVNYIYRG